MKRLSVIASFIILFLTCQTTVVAQSTGSSYRTALGAKVYFGDGTIGGINIKHFLNSHGALEGSLLFANGALGFEGMYDWHGFIQGAAGLKWYVGGGGLLMFSTRDNDGDDDVLFALKGAIGLDYKFTGAPINISFDLNPVFILTPVTDFDFMAGLAFRFTL
jgi:hypothetical protein